MDIRAQIENIYEEIISYGGNFGDPIASIFSYNSLAVLRDPTMSNWFKCGAGISLLVDFCVAIDNSTYHDALQGNVRKDIDFALEHKLCKEFPEIVHAMLAAKNSELIFYDTLQKVYVTYVKTWKENTKKA